VLVAFQNVADVLRALQADARAITAAAAAEEAANRSIDLVRRQVEQGPGIEPGAAQRPASLSANLRSPASRAQAARLPDTVALYQALGGGWWNRKLPEAPIQ
jgi:outer membrane protein TolC